MGSLLLGNLYGIQSLLDTFSLTIIDSSSIAKMKIYGDKGSPCLILLEGMNSAISFH